MTTEYIVHHPENNALPDLCGERAKDLIAVRFDASLEEMKKLMAGIPQRRMRYGLTTGKLYLSERGRIIVYEQPPSDPLPPSTLHPTPMHTATTTTTTATAHEPAPAKRRFCVQVWDSDCEYWEDVDDIPPCSSRFVAEEEARHWKSRLCGHYRTRVVLA